MIRVAVGVPEAYTKQAEYVFTLFSQHWGVPVRVVPDSYGNDVEIRYTTEPRREDGVVHIPFDARMYDPGHPCRAQQHGPHHVWSGWDDDVSASDLVGATYRLLNLLDEQQVDPEARDRRGIFRTEALPPARRQATRIPLVDDLAAVLWERLIRVRPAAAASVLPKWPDGKRYAVAVTHDTDAVALGAPRELLTNLAKLVIRRDSTYADMVRAGLQHLRDPMGNPLFGFPAWRDWERERAIPSSFYLYARMVRLKPDINNCKSSVVEQRIDWDPLRRMAADGWEFGLHAPINSKNDIDALAGGKQWIEEQLRAPVYGLRHHYWALDWIAPHKTWRKHVNSGFRYDTSMAWRDIGGFRAATCHPFRPFDPVRNAPLDIYELPTCLMDDHVVGRHGDVSRDVAAGLETIDRVKERGGAAVLDWHTETACNAFEYKNMVTTLARILAPLLADDDAWFATPWEIVRHWHQRRSALETR